MNIQSDCSNFPGEPGHGDIFELKSGLLYQYDANVNSWIEIQSSSVVLELATSIRKGAMSAADLKKLNRLVLPPPQSTITGTDCIAPFRRGTIQLLSGDDFVDVQGNVDIRNIDEFGDVISESRPFQIHQHTYGFDFTLDVPNLVQELIDRGQLNLKGLVGDKGEKGETGDRGPEEILSGPQGAQGDQGLAPSCDLSIDPEPISTEARPGLKRALVSTRLLDHATDRTKYILELDRQVIGTENASTSRFNARNSNSFWVLAVASVTGASQPIYYIDIDPIIETVHQKFISEMGRLKQGYEDIVEFWIQTMSDLFDEQKAALCCALEYCMSATKSTDLRRHMESVAAAAIGDKGAKINLHGRNSEEAVSISSTRILARMPDSSDLCEGGPDFPDGPPSPPPPPPPPRPPSPPSPPTPECFVQFDGLFITDISDSPLDKFPCGYANSPSTSVEIYTGNSRKKSGETVGYGDISGNIEDILPNAAKYTFDSMAIAPNVRVRIFEEANFKGSLILDKTGPAVIYNVIWKNDDTPEYSCDGVSTSLKAAIASAMSRPWQGYNQHDVPWNSIFPPSTRIWSGTDMTTWSAGSINITCPPPPPPPEQTSPSERAGTSINQKPTSEPIEQALWTSLSKPLYALTCSEISASAIGGPSHYIPPDCWPLSPPSPGHVGCVYVPNKYTSQFLYMTDFKFDTLIPSGATILGIKAIVKKVATVEPGLLSQYIEDLAVAFFRNVSEFTSKDTPAKGGSLQKVGRRWPLISEAHLDSIYEIPWNTDMGEWFNASTVRSPEFGFGIAVSFQSYVSTALVDCVKVVIEWENLSASASSFTSMSFGGIQTDSELIHIDPLLNIATAKSGVVVELPKGRYAATIGNMEARVGGKYGATIKIQYIDDGSKKVTKFLDKGRFDSLIDAKNSYEGLSLAFNHDGGNVYVYFPIMPTPDASGSASIKIEPVGFTSQPSIKPSQPAFVKAEVSKQKRFVPPKVEMVEAEKRPVQFICSMSKSHLNWYEKGWDVGKCCGLVVNIGGQDYIIFKRGIGEDDACGGGESASTPCIESAKSVLGQHPAFAWPTFDKKTFAPLPIGESISFCYDDMMNSAVQQKIEKSEYDNPKGDPAGRRHLAYQLSVVLFPVS